VENLLFKQLTLVECGSLTSPFLEVEVKVAVWDCDNFKSPCLDGINFGFFKDFWVELKGDVMTWWFGVIQTLLWGKWLSHPFVGSG
jgi:hypothetical protein